jgi:hypothetical protein
MTTAGNQQIALTELGAQAITVPLTHGNSADGFYEPYASYKPGDTIALDVPGSYSMSPFAIAALTCKQTDANDYEPSVNLGAVVISGPEALGLAVRQMITSVTGSTSGIGASLAGSLTLGNPRTLGDSVWTAPTLVNSWANYGGALAIAGYRKDGFGVVHLKGLLMTGTTNTTAFTLPTGYRPAATEQFGVLSGAVIGYIAIDSAGVVTPTRPGANIWLSGISFYAA